jgi:hypothetical protein
MNTKQLFTNYVSALGAFWPALQVLHGTYICIYICIYIYMHVFTNMDSDLCINIYK